MRLKIRISIVLIALLLSASISLFAQEKAFRDTLRIPLENTFNSLEDALKQPEKVFALNLAKRKYTAIPQEVYSFPNLVSLNLSANKLIEVPSEISKLKKLQVLNVSKNGIVKISKSIAELKDLRRFIAFKNEIDTIPVELTLCSNLELIDLWSNEIAFIPEEIKNLPKLKILELRDILFNEEQQQRVYNLLPNTTVYFSPSCTCKQ